jgi:hypothetical protein
MFGSVAKGGQYGSGMGIRRPGSLSALALAGSGIAIAADPAGAAGAMHLKPLTQRGIAETRVGLGGTFAGLGLWALARRNSDAYTAVGVTWLGAAAVRGLTLRMDEPETDWTFWAFFAMEVGLGVAGLVDRGARRSSD